MDSLRIVCFSVEICVIYVSVLNRKAKVEIAILSSICVINLFIGHC